MQPLHHDMENKDTGDILNPVYSNLWTRKHHMWGLDLIFRTRILTDYQDFRDASSQIGRFIEDVYMTKRIHSALGYLTPEEFESAWSRSQTLPFEASS